MTNDKKTPAKKIILWSAIGIGAYFIYKKFLAPRPSRVLMQQWAHENDIDPRIMEYAEQMVYSICDPNLFVYPNEVAQIKTYTDDELRQFHLIYDTFYRGNLCDDLKWSDLLDGEWGNYYANTQNWLISKGY